MRLEHFQKLKPVCPTCRANHQRFSILRLEHIHRELNDIIVEGVIRCDHDSCKQAYPIIDAVPILLPNIREFLAEQLPQLIARSDISPMIEAMLGDAVGPGAPFNNVRHQLSTYGWDHYGEFAPSDNKQSVSETSVPGSAVNCLDAGIKLFNQCPRGPVLDVGCAVGRTTFEIAKKISGLVLGIDISFPMARVAQQILQTGRISYPLKQLGIVYERQDYVVPFSDQTRVDFWVASALALPFTPASFGFINALNVLDIVPSPRNLLMAVQQNLVADGDALFATPYDWAPPVVMNQWFGGHNQFGMSGGDSELALRDWIAEQGQKHAGALNIVNEIPHFPWTVRVHRRRTACYDTHLLACSKHKEKRGIFT